MTKIVQASCGPRDGRQMARPRGSVSARRSLNLLAALCLATATAPLAAAPPAKSPYADLLPANQVLQDSPDRLDPVLIGRTTLGVIPSSRYVALTTRWQKWWGEKGDKSPNPFWSVMGGTKANQKLGAEASDPKRFADAALLQLTPRFGEVKVFDDLAAAREGGARFFLILDFHQKMGQNFFGATGVHGWAGALLLDGSFRRVGEVAIDKKTNWFTEPVLSMANGAMNAYAKSYDENFKTVIPAFSDALNAMLTEHGAPMPVATPLTPTAAAEIDTSVATAPYLTSADQAYLAELAAIPTAGALYAIGDEMAEKGERAKASLAFRTILTRFPDDVLAAKAADRLSNAAR